jgi:hypothetical protein
MAIFQAENHPGLPNEKQNKPEQELSGNHSVLIRTRKKSHQTPMENGKPPGVNHA